MSTASSVPASGTGAVVPSDQVQIRGVPTNAAIGLYPEIRTDIPVSDDDFILSRTSEREKMESGTFKANGRIKFSISSTNRSIIPREVVFHIRVKMTPESLQVYNDVGFLGSIQRMFKTMTIRDGRGTILQQINDYNYIAEMLRLKHIPKDVQVSSMQPEGVFDHYGSHQKLDTSTPYEIPSRKFATVPPNKTAYNEGDGTDAVKWTTAGGTDIETKQNDRGSYIFFEDPPTGIKGADMVSVGDNLLVTYVEAGITAGNRGSDPNETANMTTRIMTVIEKGYPKSPAASATHSYIQVDGDYFVNDHTLTDDADRRRTIKRVVVLPKTVDNDHRKDISLSTNKDAHLQVGLSDYAKVYRQLVGIDNTEGSDSKDGAWFSFRPFASGFFNLTQFIPMWATNGLEIEFGLASNDVALTSKNVYLVKSDANGGFEAKTDSARTPAASFEVNDGWVNYTSIEHTPQIAAAIQVKFINDGLTYTTTSYELVQKTINKFDKVNVEFQQGYTSLNRIYFAFMEKDREVQTKDSFKFLALNPDRLVLEFNRAKYPPFGDDTQLDSKLLYLESQKSIGLLDEQTLSAQSWGDFSQVDQQVHVINFEKYPEGNLTGVDTNGGRIRIRMESNEKSAYGASHTDGGSLYLVACFHGTVTLWDTHNAVIQS